MFSPRALLCYLVGIAVTLCTSAAGATENVGVRENDFHRCTPRENFETGQRERLWSVEELPLGESKIPVLTAAACVVRSAVRYPLDVVGRHQVYLGLYVPAPGLPSAVKLGLSSEPASTLIRQGQQQGGPRIEEHHWSDVDLTGNDLMIQKLERQPLRIAYIRLVPTDDDAALQKHVDLPVYRGQEAAKRFRVTLNGQEFTPEHRWFRLSIGKPHTLTVVATGDAEPSCRVEVIKTRPDSSTDTLTADLSGPARQASINLGPLAAPAAYEFEHGSIFRRGYRLDVRLRESTSDQLLARFRFYQGVAYGHDAESMYPGRERRVLHGPPLQQRLRWWVNREDGYPMYPLLYLRLAWPPVNNGQLRIEHTYRATEGSYPVVLHIENEQDKAMTTDRRLHLQPAWPGEKSTSQRTPQRRQWKQTLIEGVDTWPAGRYRIALWPVVDGKVYREGPQVIYVHKRPDPSTVFVSPYTNWAFERDPSRPELVLKNMGEAVEKYGDDSPDVEGWSVNDKDGQLVGNGKLDVAPIRLAPELTGHYAVFARPVSSCMLRFSGEDFLRPARPDPAEEEPFVAVLDMSGKLIDILPSRLSGKGVAGLRFVPVTQASAAAFVRETENPAVKLSGVADWHGIYSSAGGPEIVQLQPTDFDLLYHGHRELGMRTVDWAVGRSFLLYHSQLPNTTLIGSLCKGNIPVPYIRLYHPLLQRVDPLDTVVALGKKYDQRTSGWLCMNRCYGSSHSGVFSSKFYADHPEWHFRDKNGNAQAHRVCYFFEELRQERVAVLTEVAQRGVDSLLLDFNRQPPMIGYHPEMVRAFNEKTGMDAMQIDAAKPDAYLRWLRYRAEFITMILRDLHHNLQELERDTGRRVPVVARLPGDGLLCNLAAGIDVETWCHEELVDRLQIAPLNPSAGGESMDIRPYLELGHKAHVKVFGGVNENMNLDINPVAFLRRAIGLSRAGVDGIEIYESERYCDGHPSRWLGALAGHPDRAEQYLTDSNLEACYPVDAWGAVGGWDNHFQVYRRTMYDAPGQKEHAY